jgi:tetratricopeptide (TPR) repeat protein
MRTFRGNSSSNGWRPVCGAMIVSAVMALAQTADPYPHATALYRSANCPAAVPELRASIATQPRANLMLGRCYFELQQYKDAMEALTNYRKSAPQDVTAVILLAQAAEKNGSGEAAVKLLDDYLRSYPAEIEAHSALGDLYVRLGRGPEAIAQYRMVTEKQPDDPGARIGSGLMKLRDRKWQEAVEDLEQARKSVPDDPRVLSGIGDAYLGLEKCEPALGPLRQALNLAPDDFAFAKKVATCASKLQKWSDVLGALRTGTPQESADEEATMMVVKAYQASGNAAQLEELYCRQVLSDSPANVSAHVALGKLLDTPLRIQEAKSQYEAAAKLRDLPAINERLGDIALADKNKAEARKYYEAAAQSKSGTDEVRLKLARICFDTKDPVCANQQLRAITNPALSREVKLLRAQIEFEAKNYDEAGRLARELLQTDRHNLTIVTIAAKVALEKDQELEAADLFEEALALAPLDKELSYQIVEIYLNSKDDSRLPRAVQILNDYLTKSVKDATGYLYLGNVYYKRKDFDNADANFRKGFEQISPPYSPKLSWAFTAYGNLLFEQGKFEDARVKQTEALRLNPNDETSVFNLAITCLALKRTDEVGMQRAKLEELHSPLLQQLEEYIKESEKPRKKTK